MIEKEAKKLFNSELKYLNRIKDKDNAIYNIDFINSNKEVIVVEGAGSQTGTNRNGDYAHGCLDPDGVTIWSTSEYMGGQTGFSAARTRIFSYQIEPCIAAAVSIELVGATNPICANEAITLNATPAYGGDSPQYEWFLNGNALNLNDDNAVIVTPQNGDVITCTMISNEPGLEGVMVTSNEIWPSTNEAWLKY
jgi:hypothetical protein